MSNREYNFRWNFELGIFSDLVVIKTLVEKSSGQSGLDCREFGVSGILSDMAAKRALTNLKALYHNQGFLDHSDLAEHSPVSPIGRVRESLISGPHVRPQNDKIFVMVFRLFTKVA